MAADRLRTRESETVADPTDVGPAARLVIAAVLALDPALARSIRARAVRTRPRPEVGPTAEYGSGDD